MNLIKCTACQKEISENAKMCPNCGQKNKKPGILLWIIGIILAISFLSSLLQETSDRKIAKLKDEILIENNLKKIYPETSDSQSETMYLLYVGKDKDMDTLSDLLLDLRNSKSDYCVFDNIGALEIWYLNEGAGLLSSPEFLNEIDILFEKYRCNIDKHLIGFFGGEVSSLKKFNSNRNTVCPKIDLDKIEKLKKWKEQLLKYKTLGDKLSTMNM